MTTIRKLEDEKSEGPFSISAQPHMPKVDGEPSEISSSDLERELSTLPQLPPNRKPFVVRELEAKARVFEERNKLYGDNYKRFGYVMVALFPNGLNLKSAEDFNRFGILVQLVAKETRYAENFVRGGHDDSLDDTAVYAMMLKELDQK